MNKRQKRGLAVLVAPFVGLAVIFGLQVVAWFIYPQPLPVEPHVCVGTKVGGCDTAEAADNGVGKVVIDTLSSLLGFAVVLGFLPCLITGIILLASKDSQDTTPQVSA